MLGDFGEIYVLDWGIAMDREGADPDRMGGVIESPVFVIQGKEATFQLGGVAAQLTLNTAAGREVRRSNQWAPGGMKRVRWA